MPIIEISADQSRITVPTERVNSNLSNILTPLIILYHNNNILLLLFKAFFIKILELFEVS